MIHKKRFILFWCIFILVLCASLFAAMPIRAQNQQAANKAKQAKTLIVKIRGKNSFGAGILFSVRGGYPFIATANHVVEGSPRELEELSVEFEFLRGVSVQAEFWNSYPKLDLAVLRVDIQKSRLRDVRVEAIPFDLLCKMVNLQRGDEVYPVGHPEGLAWDVPLTPSIVKKVIAEEISFEPACFAGHSGGGLFDENWTLVGMITRTLGRSCEAISFERICATLEDDWGLVVNHDALPLISTPPIPTPTMQDIQPTPRPQSPMSKVPEKQVESTFGLDENWQPLIYVENTFEDRGQVVVDYSTGLMWQKSGSERELSYKEARMYIKEFNSQKFAGYDDWRLPTLKELMTLLEAQKLSNNLYIDPIFHATQKWCWSATGQASASAWSVNFKDGSVYWNVLEGIDYVRMVRSFEEISNHQRIILRSTPLTVSYNEAPEVFGLTSRQFDGGKGLAPQTYTDNQYEDQGNVVVDHATGLMWQRSGSDTYMSHAKAQEYIKDLNRQQFAGYNDWRLPTIPELMSLLEPERLSNNLYIAPIFDSTQKWCWSVDLRQIKGEISTGSAWYVDFTYDGDVGCDEFNYDRYVRAVRSMP